jgi:hypothetical protein
VIGPMEKMLAIGKEIFRKMGERILKIPSPLT